MTAQDIIPLPRFVFHMLLQSPHLHRAQKIWLEQFGYCACGARIDKAPFWLKNESAVCEACRKKP